MAHCSRALRFRGRSDAIGDPASRMNIEAFNAKCRALIAELGICDSDAVRSIETLGGGVSSEIAAVDLGSCKICVKFALGQLRVKQDWRAPVERNKAEYDWLEFAAKVVPGSVPAVLGRSESLNGFAMEYFGPASSTQWKNEILAGIFRKEDATAVAELLGRIHAASAAESFDSTKFQNLEDFRQLRVDPYLVAAADRHPPLARTLLRLAKKLLSGKSSILIHGDASPKNILLRDGEPILLDAECATVGDPAFDVAFLLNHLTLKAIHLPQLKVKLIESSAMVWRVYRGFVDWEDSRDLELRISELLPALMLARVHGKSPVEYLSKSEMQKALHAAETLLINPPQCISEFLERAHPSCVSD